MSLSPGTKLGIFEITGLLGKGGMGEVYRARDEKLGREVAIKVLPEAFAKDSERLARFEREAKMLAALDHSNIGALYEFRQEAGVHFLVMQLAKGESLANRLARGPLSVSDALPIFAQIAEALEAAHERSIVHRDLKPANIQVAPDGEVKVLDFGLAKTFAPTGGVSQTAPTRISRSDPTHLTTEHVILGTAPYMSPEQARGSELDSRSDVWAFGCCLYQALTGGVPFRGQTVPDILSAVLQNEPDWNALPPDLPEPLRRMLRRSLQKDVGKRMRDIGDARIELQELIRERESGEITTAKRAPAPDIRKAVTVRFAVAGFVLAVLFMFAVTRLGRDGVDNLAALPTEQNPIRSLAVLPFDDYSDDPGQEFFVDAMTDALTAELGKIKALKVISRTSAMQYKGTDKTLSEIADELGVEALVEGSVSRAGDNVRITAQLIHVATDSHLLSENYPGTLENIFELQSEVAMAIAEAIRVAVTPEEETRIASAREVNPEAYEAYLRGRFFFWKFTPDGFQKAVESFQRALALDPNFAEAHAALGRVFWMQSILAIVPPAAAVARARPAIDKALALDDTLADAHDVAGLIARTFDWDWTRAERESLRAIELNPGSPDGYNGLGYYYLSLGRFDDAIHKMQEAIDLDPLNLSHRSGLAHVYGWAGRSEEAIAQYQKVLELEPAFMPALEGGSLDYVLHSRYDEAVELIERGMAIHGRLPLLLGHLVWAHAAAGRTAEAEALLAELYARDRDDYVSAFIFAFAYGALGDMDEAFRWIDQAIENRDLLLSQPYWLGWNLLRGDSRFIDMLRRINYPAIEDFKAKFQPSAADETAQAPVD